ncbi:Mu-like prophage FluMu protein gp28 [Komagataeibacter europaeus NBRC 3261]|uniref:Mu-like prophage FluMu protein gp28 n=1 Tax=Komagataeibacter europaeus NBRC 3261 TaxID=1234669 RepID=A0A0D6Q1W6_KOMEU|nr:hypothetical protein [Komagataeibacter europaeus]GAN97572.1 Mu-like prophage FluMu protein gp28 [Komagataeibacter europaeus NBRC 3261]
MNDLSDPLLPYQKRVIEAVGVNDVVVIEKSRRIGISWVLSWLAVMTAGAGKSAGGMDVFYMGYEKDMTRQFIEDCATHAEILNFGAKEVGETLFHDPDRPDADIKVFRIDFESGYEILSLPSVPRAFRSKQGLVILDEAAFVDDLEAMIDAAMALLIWGGKVVILSTHNGDTNPFNQLIHDVRAGKYIDEVTGENLVHLMRITFNEAEAEGLFHKICQRKGEVWTQDAEDAWRRRILKQFGSRADQELHVIPSPSTGAFIPRILIEARSQDDIEIARWECDAKFTMLPEHIRRAECEDFCRNVLAPLLAVLDPTCPHAFGEDFARSGDLTVLWFLAILSNQVRRTAFVTELRNVPFEQQKQILWFILDRLPRFRSGAMDSTGNGQWLGEVTRQQYGERVQCIHLSEGWYRENMPPLKGAFEDEKLLIPNDRDTHDDIRALTLVRGVARVPEKRTTGASGNRHGDAAVALALAYFASKSDPAIYEYTRAPSPQQIATGAGLSRDDCDELEDAGVAMGNLGLRGSV